MQWTIPGTVLTSEATEANHIEELFSSMFLGGGIVLSQVANITGLETHTIQNWVKRKFLAPPRNKRYDKEQVCRIILINMLKGALTLEQICSMISSINGDLTDEDDDIIDDALLYFMFIRLAARARHIGGTKEWGEAIADVTADYQEPYPGAKEKVIQVLRIMLTAWVTTQLRAQVDQMVSQLQSQ